MATKLHCSFCGKSEDEIKKLAAGPSGIFICDECVAVCQAIMQGEEAGSMLRISVSGGGCSGFQYGFDVVKKPAADDLVIERDGARVAIDEVSLRRRVGVRIRRAATPRPRPAPARSVVPRALLE